MKLPRPAMVSIFRVVVLLLTVLFTVLSPATARAVPGRLLYTLGYDFGRPGKISVGPDNLVYVPSVEVNKPFPYAGQIKVYDSGGAPVRSFGNGYLSFPTAVAVTNQRIYVSNDDYSGISMFDRDGIYIRMVSISPFKDIAAGPDGKIYALADFPRMMVFDSDLNTLGDWAIPPGAGGTPIAAAFDIDPSGNIVAADSMNSRLLVVSPSGEYLREVPLAGNPFDVACGPDGGFRTLESGDVVRVYSAAGEPLFSFGQPDPQEMMTRSPVGIAVDGTGKTYRSETGPVNRVQVFSPEGTLLRDWVSSLGNWPWGVTIDDNGDVCVANLSDGSISIYDKEGAFVRKWIPHLPPSIAANYRLDVILVAAHKGRVLLTGPYWVWEFDKFGYPLGVAGSNGWIPDRLPDPPPPSITLPKFFGVAVNQSGRVVTTSGFGSPIAMNELWAGQIDGGFGPFASYPPEPGEMGNCVINVDKNGFSFVSHEGNFHIKVFDPAGTLVRTISSADFPPYPAFEPHGTAVDDLGNLYVAGNNWIPYLAVLSGSGTSGIWLSDGFTPYLLAVTPDGSKIYASGGGDSLVHVYEGLYPPPPSDITPPETGIGLSGPLRNGWFSGDVSVTLSAHDPESGVWEIHYRVDGGPDTVVQDANATILLAANGFHNVCYYAVNTNGLTETEKCQAVNVDKVAPDLSTGRSPAANAAGWNNADVTVTFTATDLLSGVESITPPATLTSEGKNQSVTGTAMDRAGNQAEIAVSGIDIDRTPPVVTVSGISEGASYILGAAPSATYEATDVLSGVQSSSSSLSGGNANGVGAFVYKVTALDMAGNRKETSVAYNVAYDFGGFLFPMNLGKPFKQGSTIPIKFRLADASGSPVSVARATLMLQKYVGTEPAVEPFEMPGVNQSDSGNVFRYDNAEAQYIFNLGTKQLGDGTWHLTVMLDDGTTKAADIYLKP